MHLIFPCRYVENLQIYLDIRGILDPMFVLILRDRVNTILKRKQIAPLSPFLYIISYSGTQDIYLFCSTSPSSSIIFYSFSFSSNPHSSTCIHFQLHVLFQLLEIALQLGNPLPRATQLLLSSYISIHYTQRHTRTKYL